MDMYFWSEILFPIFILIGFWFSSQFLLRKFKKQGLRWTALFSLASLILMVCVYVYFLKYSSQLQCVAAYGEMVSDTRMCDNPAAGLGMMLQFPILVLAWIVSSVFAAFKLTPLITKN